MASNIGIVPNPNINIKIIDSIIFPVPVEIMIAEYNGPQGRNPFKKPMRNRLENDLVENSFLNPFFKLPNNENPEEEEDERLNLKRDGKATVDIIKTPVIIDNHL